MVPVFGRVVLQEDSLQVALLTATSGVGIAAGAVLAAPVGGRLGGRVVVLAGLALAAAALAVTTYLLAHQLGRFDFILVLFAFGIGYGLVYAKITEVVLLDVPRQDVGLASGMLVASRTCAMAIGSAALTAIMLASSDGTSALSETESASSHTAFGLGAAFLVAAFFVALAIPRDTQVHSNASAHGAHDLWKKYGV
jgi:MFS family permease